ncbi:MAG: type I restriction endonuclease [Planctomycetota bacterium]
MDLAARLVTLSDRLPSIEAHLATEEATKNALIMPFLQVLEYDIFNPREVVPEFVADVGIKRGEKVDYAILRDGKPVVLFECKRLGQSLKAHGSQLFRYFGTTDAHLGVLTDGVEYRFYSDLDTPNRMDETPFLVFRINSPSETAVAFLKLLCKPTFDREGILRMASTLRDRKSIRSFLEAKAEAPSEELTRFIAGRLHQGRLTKGIVESYTVNIRRAFQDLVNTRVEARLRTALDSTRIALPDENPTSTPNAPAEQSYETPEVELAEPEVVTTPDELAGLYIVKAILRDEVDVGRIVARDVRSYFGILLDDNNRKAICRLHFNGKQKYIGLLDAEKNETREPIDTPDGIFKFADQLRSRVNSMVHSVGASAPADS